MDRIRTVKVISAFKEIVVFANEPPEQSLDWRARAGGAASVRSLLPRRGMLRDPPAFHKTGCTAKPMTQILIACPITGNVVPTGVYVLTIEDLAPNPYILERCHACREPHEWIREDAVMSLH